MSGILVPSDPGACSFEPCHARAVAKGLCLEHYCQRRASRPPTRIDRENPGRAPEAVSVPGWMRNETDLERMLSVTESEGE